MIRPIDYPRSPEVDDPRAWRWMEWAAVAAVWFAFAMLMVPVGARPEAPGGTFAFDFRDTVWVPMRDLWAGNVPWDVTGYAARHPFSQICPLYLPSYWVFAVPLLFAPYWVALTLWIGCLAVCVVALVRFSLVTVAGVARSRRGMMLAAVLLVFILITPPVKSGVLATNWAIVCAVAGIIAARGVHRRNVEVFLTCLAIVKPQVGLPLLALQLLTGRWKVAAWSWFLSFLLALPVVTLAVRNAKGVDELLRMFLETASHGEGVALADPGSTRLDLIGTLGHQGVYPSALTSGLITAGMAVVTLGTAALAWRRLGGGHPLFVLMAGFGILLVTPNWLYAVTALVPGLVGLFFALKRGDLRGPERWAGVACLVMSLVPFVTFQRLSAIAGISQLTFNTVNGLALNLAAVAGCIATVLVINGRENRD